MTTERIVESAKRQEHAVTALNLRSVAERLTMSARFLRLAREEAEAALKLAMGMGDIRFVSLLNGHTNALTIAALDAPDVGDLEMRIESLRAASYGIGGLDPTAEQVITSDLGDQVRTTSHGGNERRPLTAGAAA